jgi:pyridoxamine 5'-phosphate oxidase
MQEHSDRESQSDPIRLFGEWYRAAEQAGVPMPEAMTLATASIDAIPSARMVLLKGWDEEGFAFFTNYASRKARDLDTNPRAALCFHWVALEQQVRIEGSVERIGAEESFAYFRTRPRGSRIGAWASRQSETLEDRAILEQRVHDIESRFSGDDIPLPPFWGGYRLRPVRIEFWQGQPSRLHDRLLFTRSANGWMTQRLYP